MFLIFIIHLFFLTFLIGFFLFLIFYQTLSSFFFKEGFDNSVQYVEYQPNPLILSQQNAGNIEYLKKEMDELKNLNKTVVDLSNNYVDLYNQVQGLSQAQASYGAELNGGSSDPITITGTDTSEDNDVSAIDTSSTINTATSL